MKHLKRFSPSPAMIVACAALFVALGGVGYAAATIGSAQIKNNSIQGKDVKNSSLTGKDVKNSSLTGSDIKNSSLAGRDVKNNSLTGSDVLESSLGTVPNANHANSADNANTVGGKGAGSFEPSGRTFHFNGVVPSGQTKTIAQVGPFRVAFTCNDGGTAGNAGWIITNTGEDNSDGQGSDGSQPDFDIGETVVTDDSNDPGDLAGAVSPSGFAVSVLPGVSQDAADASSPMSSGGCVGSGAVFNDGK